MTLITDWHSVMTLITDSGYQFIGMDYDMNYFARLDDEPGTDVAGVTSAPQFPGVYYHHTTTYGECDLLGPGILAISTVGDYYVQNQKVMYSYRDFVEWQGNSFWCLAATIAYVVRCDVIKALIF
ncbi:hypothetical protein [Sodalis-like endosymbiont of Proechinophthirus fluctus]|uniref:hypothetical protein n=1 Tax=Sodalis-like endosymbiont of Proechinophthirus fluctus TaxID=1462730 RepID=UPI00082D4337|nr:hypothetical protein [Sodalis-like endosymbiont of Proechinophthirus fluctus]